VETKLHPLRRVYKNKDTLLWFQLESPYLIATKTLNTLALANFALPGEAGFPLNAMYEKPRDRTESDLMRQYLTQIRQELTLRLVERVYAPTYADTDGGKKPTKWWMSFQKRKFMNKAL
jgi:actin related protein 2/3 complex subunit 3